MAHINHPTCNREKSQLCHSTYVTKVGYKVIWPTLAAPEESLLGSITVWDLMYLGRLGAAGFSGEDDFFDLGGLTGGTGLVGFEEPCKRAKTLPLLCGGEVVVGINLTSGVQASANLPTTGSKLSLTPSEVKNTISPRSIIVMDKVRLLNSGLLPSAGPKAPKASRISRIEPCTADRAAKRAPSPQLTPSAKAIAAALPLTTIP
ncbi:hypothetical protein FF38_10295 [Lucilia cuprina]|uniref:Uncharacterized protein n=1 Tax=Lucilia cuprina TaxID=7375 RepID=A0A0L0CLD7_LUCCU|nr:hypothetical protein FF38_10295 [Lucilia cuprina]